MTARQQDREAQRRLLAQVDRNSVVAEAIERVVDRRVAERRWPSVLAWARIGAAFAATNPTTAFRSLRVERALDAASRHALGPAPARRHPGAAEQVLHVLSEAHLIGGHIRTAVRWATLDEGRASSFVVTRPGMDHPVLHDVAATRHGRVTVLSGPLLDRAARLRELTGSFDVVVCHTHNDDTVPAVAFGGSYDGAPVVLINHADHVFFLGTGNVATVANLRTTGADFSLRARSFPQRSSYLLPIPLHGDRRLSRPQAKARLGIEPDRVVALTLAREKKYLPSPLHAGFVDIVAPVFAARGALLLAVGPRPDQPPWREAADSLDGRLRVEGPQPDPEVYLDAADVYVDSIPLCSNTSMLEAAFRATPIVTLRPYSSFLRLHVSDGVLDDALVIGTTIDEHRSLLGRLLDDEAHRRAVGSATVEAVRSTHGDNGWRRALEGLYEHAMAADPVTERTPHPDPDGTDRAETRHYAAALAGIESATPLLHSVMTAMEAFDPRDRRAQAARVAAARLAAKARRGVSGADLAGLLVPGLR